MNIIPRNAKILYREVEEASRDIKVKFIKTRKKAQIIRVLIIVLSSVITLLNVYGENSKYSAICSVLITTAISIEAVFGWGKKSTQEHDYYCSIEMLRIELEMYLSSESFETEEIDKYAKRFSIIRSNFHKNRIDTVTESFQI